MLVSHQFPKNSLIKKFDEPGPPNILAEILLVDDNQRLIEDPPED
jgi:hypothetical protein